MQEIGMTRRFDPGSELSGHQPVPVPNPREVARAVGVGEIRPWYQPLVRLADREVIALEALARWDSPHRGMVYPADFIATAEESELVIQLDRAMAKLCLADLAGWSEKHPDLQLNLNLSGRNLDEADCFESMRALTAEAGADPTRVTLEFTEHRPPSDLEVCARNIAQLREAGFRVWLDDFGSGWSGLQHLIVFKVDGVKLDSAFVEAIDSRPGATVVAAVTSTAASLGMSVTVEGVETEDQAARAIELGADYGQGFLWSPALPLDRVLG
jgi:EAL domain-containing protein (putative c-di-GMP-specific phosphodiesterase class I)